MKQIGLIGGTSWPSTVLYYDKLNRMANEKFGEWHSARILLWSIDYHDIKSNYHHGWDKIPKVLKREVEAFLETSADCLVLCNNTLHEALDIIQEEIQIEIPVFHIVDLTAKRAKEEKLQDLLLLGTQYTMEHGYYSGKLEQAGFSVTIPDQSEREQIQEVQTAISLGVAVNEQHKSCLANILSNYSNADAVVTACTELPLAITPEITDLRILDPLDVQCEEAFSFATS